MQATTKLQAALIALVLLGPALAGGLGQAQSGGQHTSTDATITSFDGTPINVTVFQPEDASSTNPVPVLLHGHGWSGSRWTEVSDAEDYLEAGYGVVSIDQRGHGTSGGQAEVMDPDFEAEDVQAVIDHVASLAWVQLDDAATDDPVLGAIGGSYGGGYQFITALDETHESSTDETRLDALAPDITWFNLTQSLAPNDVPRSVWIDALYWLAKAGPTEIAPWIDDAYQASTVTGSAAADAGQRFYEHSPAWFADQGTQLDIPVLITQGEPDNLFPLNQAVDNWETTLTDAARGDSFLVGHLSGHTLPGVAPPGSAVPGANPCESAFNGTTGLRIAFFDTHLKGLSPSLPAKPIQLATEDGNCLSLDSLPDTDAFDVSTPVVVNAGAAGAPVRVPIDGAGGPVNVSGIPTLDATLEITRPSVAAFDPVRVFVGIAVGATPADARVLGNQWMPIQRFGAGTFGVSMDLAGVSDEVGAHENLYLVVSPNVDQFAHHPSRSPAIVELTDAEVGLPITP